MYNVYYWNKNKRGYILYGIYDTMTEATFVAMDFAKDGFSSYVEDDKTFTVSHYEGKV